MGRRPRAAAVSGDMRHKALPHGAGTHVSRDVADDSGRAAVARPARDGAETARGNARTVPRRGASRPDASRKGAFCGPRVAQNAPFRHITAREARDHPPPPACGALWKMAQLGKRARAPPRQAAGGVAPGTRRPRPGARPHGKAQSVFWFNKNCAVPIWEQDGLPCTIHLHDVVAISSRHTKTGMQATRGEQRAGRVVAAQAPTT